jgi:hypothetical protein
VTLEIERLGRLVTPVIARPPSGDAPTMNKERAVRRPAR